MTLLTLTLTLSLLVGGAPGDPAPRELPVVDPALRTPAGDPSDTVAVVVYLRREPIASVAGDVRVRRGPAHREIARAIRRERPRNLPAAPRTTQEERGDRPRSPASSRSRRLVAELDRVRAAMRHDLGNRLHRALAPGFERVERALERAGGRATGRIPLAAALSAILPRGRLDELARVPLVSRIEPDAPIRANLAVSGEAMGAPTWWSAGLDGGALDVALVDTGIDVGHPALAGPLVFADVFLQTAGLPPWDATPDDVNGHGTHLAGIVTSIHDEHRGVAYGLEKLFNVKAAFDLDGASGGEARLFPSDGMRGIDWAVTHPGDSADILSFSFGARADRDDSGFMRFFDAVVSDLQVAVAVSAGNDGPDEGTVARPGIAYNVLCVANVDDRGTAARGDDRIRFSSGRGPTPGGRRKPDLAAPGTRILSTHHDWEGARPDFVSRTGSSMAAPQIAGALLLLQDAGLSDPLEQRAVLLNTAEDLGDPEWDPAYGFGYVDLDHAFAHRHDVFLSSIAPEPDAHLYVGPALADDRATLVWNRRAAYNGRFGPSEVHPLSNLDLLLYDEADGALLDGDTSAVDSVHQVRAPGGGRVVVKVDATSPAFAGANRERYALATEELFAAAVPSRFRIALDVPERIAPGEAAQIRAVVTNGSRVALHDVALRLALPPAIDTDGALALSLGRLAADEVVEHAWPIVAPLAGGPFTVTARVESLSYGEPFESDDAATIRVDRSLGGSR